MHLVYDRGPFSTSGLSIQVRGNISSYHSVWRFGDAPGRPAGNRAHPGQRRRRSASRARRGLAVGFRGAGRLPDAWSSTTTAGSAPRDGSRTDLYFFGYGWDYPDAVRRCTRCPGPTPVLPRFALGNWWSRYHRYTADGIHQPDQAICGRGHPVLGQRARHGLAPGRCRGASTAAAGPVTAGTGSCSPIPAQFLGWLHEQGLRVTLNVHPADGVRAFEDSYPEMARALGVDPASGDAIAFDVTDQAFLTAYFEILHRSLERRRGGFLVDRLAVRPAFPGRRHRPAVDAQPFPFPGQRPGWQAALDLLPIRRAGQPPLPGRVLRRHPGHLGVPGFPAVFHRDRVEHRLRLVEPRHRRPHVRRQGRRTRHQMGSAGRVLADPAAAFEPQPVQHQGAVAVRARSPVGDDATTCGCGIACCPICTR